MTMGEAVLVGGRDRREGGDDDVAGMLPLDRVSRMFRRADLVTYGDARREFFIQVDLNPFRTRTPAFHARMEDVFEQWFALDCQLDVGGLTPFAVAAAYARDEHGVDEDGYRDLCELSSSNFASWFWVRGASAACGTVTVEDLAGGGMYEVADRPLACRLDGARGGSLVGRLARVRGAWRMPWRPLYEARIPGDERFRLHMASMLHAWDPGFVDYARMLYGRDACLKVDWDAMA
ncbi:hypothetical protein [Bifidobacterium platyrrhinorum]|uniref:Uncharacterized protein n=1 Tax=Bifidobacterium platyrrhinorum TaxID=2661628 RepID=A0A6L9SRR3_9BIFI|nr:hypothetical protein [Bifidobacterium platyrrhinorum]NEG55194.1 hypothetical protein [Bifidobacterium platyrrhinorum]